MVGGVCVNTGTIPSKTLREAVLYLTGLSQREMYGQSYRVKEEITMDDLSRARSTWSSRRSRSFADQLPATTSSCSRRRRASSTRTRSRRRDGDGRGRRTTADDRHRRPGPSPRARRRRVRRVRPILDSDGILDLEKVPRLAGGRRRRRHRHRVRVDVRRARHQGHRGREARPPARVLRREIVEALQYHLRDLGGARSASARRSTRSRRHEGGAVTRSPAARGSPPTPCCTRPAVTARPTAWASKRSASGRRPRPHQGRRELPDRGARTSTPSAT